MIKEVILDFPKLEIFCGTGGVGKTTLAASRAYFWALQGKKVLLITIDPSQRLKQILCLREKLAGEVENIYWPDCGFDEGNFHALLMNPRKTLEKIILRQIGDEEERRKSFTSNRILNILSRPYGGLHEILGVLEVEAQLNSNMYDKVILDTAPGEHFLDFLDNGKRFKAFFEQNFIEMFIALKNKLTQHKTSQIGFFGHFIQSGIKKLLDYLQHITGEKFVNEFIDTVGLVYRLKSSFLKAIQFEADFLLNQNRSLWFLVTAVDHDKIKEAIILKQKVQEGFFSQGIGIINKCQARNWEKAYEEQKLNSKQSIKPRSKKIVEELYFSFKVKEEKIREMMTGHFSKVVEFDEVIDNSPLVQLKELVKSWPHWEENEYKTNYPHQTTT